MTDTFFVGVYPGIDDARMDYVIDVFGRFMAQRPGGSTAGWLRRRGPLTAWRSFARSHAWCATSPITVNTSTRSSSSRRSPVPQFKPGQFLHLAIDPYDGVGFWPESEGLLDRQLARGADQLSITYAVKGSFTTRMERELVPGATPSGSSCRTASS